MADLENNATMREALDTLEMIEHAIPYVYQKSPQNELAELVRMAKRQVRAVLAAQSESPSNAAAMREALVQCELFLSNVFRHGHPTLNPGDKCVACAGADELRGMVVRALSMPARNCDVLSEKEANEAWDEYRHSRVLPRGGWDFRHIIAWLYAGEKEKEKHNG